MTAEAGKAPNPNARALQWTAFAIVTALVLAIVCFFVAAGLDLAALFAVPMPGAFGAAAADLHVTPGQYAAAEAHAESLRASANLVVYLMVGLVAASVIATAWCAWKTRAAFRSWHWLSFFGLACFVSLPIAANFVSTSKPSMLWLLALDALAATCATIDLTRRQYGAPGRVVAWSTCVLSLAVGLLFWNEALGPSGVIGRWLH